MGRFLIRRIFFLFISVLGATMVVFVLSNFAGDPRDLYAPDTAQITQEQWDRLSAFMGLDKPLYQRYGTWLGHMARGDMGFSYGQNRPVRGLITSKLMATATLAAAAWTFAIVVGVSLGILAAVRRASVWDYFGRGFALFGQALPTFWIGLIFIWIFAVELRWFPVGTKGTGFSVSNYILPSIVLGWPAAAAIMRLTRSAMLEVMDSEYIKLARAKGVGNFAIVWKHGLKNAVITPLTSALFILAGYLNGALVVETIFAWPGIGWLALNRAVYDNDFPLLLATVLVFLIFFVTLAFLADILYAVLDPRIRYT